MEIVQEIGSYVGFAAVVGLAVLAGLYFSQARDVKRLREWAGRAPEDVQLDPELAAREATAPAQGAVTPKPAVPKPAAKPVTAAGKAAPAAAGAATAAGKQAPPVPGGAPAPATAGAAKQPVPATAQGATATAGKAPGGPTAGGGTAAPPKPGAGTPGAQQAPAPAGAPPPPPKIPRPGAPGSPPTLPPRRPTTQTRIVPPYDSSDKPRRSRFGSLLAHPRNLVLAILGVLVIGGGVAYGALQLTGEEEPASEQAAGDGGGGKDGGKAAPVDPSTVTVSVLNGTTIPGLAAQVGDEIERKGFQLGNVTNSAEQGARAESVVLFAPGSEREAIAAGRRLKISQREPINPESQALGGDATVVVVVGADQTQ
jgi:hypothetical protein